MSIKADFLKGMMAGAGGFLVSVALNLLLIPLIIRFLGVEDFGFYVFLLSFAELLMAMDMGLTTGLIHRISSYLETQNQAKVMEQLCICQWLYGTLAFLLFLVGLAFNQILPGFFHLSITHQAIAPMAILIVFTEGAINLFNAYFHAILKAHQKYHRSTITVSLRNTLANGISVLLLFMGYGLLEILWGRLVVSTLTQIALFIQARQIEPNTLQLRFRFPMSGIKDIFGISLYAMIQRISILIAHRIDELVIAVFLTMTQVGIYGLIMRILSQIGSLCFMMMEGMFPVFTRMAGSQQVEKSRFFFLRATAFIHFGVSLLLLLVWGNFPEIVLLLGSGEIQYQSILPLLALLSIVTWSGAVQMPAANYLFASGLHRFQTVSSLVTASANLGLSLWWVQHWGIVGVALGTLVPHSIQHQIVTIPLACRKQQLSLKQYFYEVYLKNLLPLFVALITFWFGRSWAQNWLNPEPLTFLSMVPVSAIATGLGLTVWLYFSASSEEKTLVFQKIQSIFSRKEKLSLFSNVMEARR